MGVLHPGVPPWLVTWAAGASGVRYAVETGTFRGDSAECLAVAFGHCTSIEISQRYAELARQRFAGRSDIRIVEGDSRATLPAIAAELDGPAFFWLDGHWSGGDTGGADAQCPIMLEVDAILGAGRADDIIAVDDARLFGMSHELDPELRDYPRLVTLLNELERNGGTTFVVDDVVIRVPGRLAPSFMSLHANSEIRQNTNFGQIWDLVESTRQTRGSGLTHQPRWKRTLRRLRLLGRN